MRIFTFMLIFLIGLFIHGGFPIQAQPDSMSVSFGAGWNHSKILDEFISPMQYKGGGYLFRTGLDEYNESFFDILPSVNRKGFLWLLTKPRAVHPRGYLQVPVADRLCGSLSRLTPSIRRLKYFLRHLHPRFLHDHMPGI